MKNFTYVKNLFFIFLTFFIFAYTAEAQVCGTPGLDGPATVSSSINTYYPVAGDITLNTGAQSILLGAVAPADLYGNNFGTIQISTGDLLLIIQIQDAQINYANSPVYGSGLETTGADGLGGTGFTDGGSTGVFEYVIATNNVPLAGGNLTFKGAGAGGGVINSFYNATSTATRGKRTFQIIRVPQYSNLTLTTDITTPPFNGTTGGVIAFNVSGTFNFNGKTINGSARGFRGGYSPIADSDKNNSTIYVGLSSSTAISGKGEGIAGTPRYMWDGYNQVDNVIEGLPGGSAGRGAPGNAGGGGNDHNAGGGGGGNGGFGGLGGKGWQGALGNISPLTGGGRPGYKSYLSANPSLDRLFLGGGGGAGDANNATSGVKGGVGGAIILINAGNTVGTGYIYANGGAGAPGAFSGSADGAGGGGAGGTVLLNISNPSTGSITIQAKGGKGGNTETSTAHGPGGGGGGGIIRHNLLTGVTISASAIKGIAGKINNGAGDSHGALDGQDGYIASFGVEEQLPPYLQVNANCLPSLDVKVKSLYNAVCNVIEGTVSYEIEIKNTGSGNAAGVALNFAFPTGIVFSAATATYSFEATGPAGLLTNTSAASSPIFGGFNIAQNGVVTITLIGKIQTINPGIYSASAQALYLDPKRTDADSNRKVTAFTNSFNSANTFYQTEVGSKVPGMNFNGAGLTVDDIEILKLPTDPRVDVIQPDCTLPTGTLNVINPANGAGISYTLIGVNPVGAPISNSTGIFSGLVPGSYDVTTTNGAGCTSIPSNIVINAVAATPVTTSVSICVGETGYLTAVTTECLNGSVNWYNAADVYLGTGASFNPVGVAGSGLLNTNTPGTTTFYASCSSDPRCKAATNFIINPKPTISVIAGAVCGPGEVTLSATASDGIISWYANATDGAPLRTGVSFTTPVLSVSKTYYVEVIANGCSSGRVPVIATVKKVPTITSTTPGSRCGSGTVTLQATASAGTVNWYSSVQGGSPLFAGLTFTTPVINVTTTYYVDAILDGCASGSRVAVAATVNPKPAVPTIGTITQPSCSTATGSFTITNYNTANTYTFSPAGPTVNSSGVVTASPGTYTITSSAGGCSDSLSNIVIDTQPATPKPPLVGTITQPTCNVTSGSVFLSALPSGNWTITRNPGAVTTTGNTTIATISGLPAGTFRFTITNASGCTSVVSANVRISPVPTPLATPTVRVIQQPTCAVATGSVTLSALPSRNWTITIYPGGETIAGNTASTTISGLATGSYTFTVTNDSGCISAQTDSVVIDAQPATPSTPTVGTITQPNCAVATGSVELTGLPAGAWTINPGNISGNTATTVISGLTAGSYSYTVTNAVGCISVESVNILINAQPATPAVPVLSAVTQPTCVVATGSFTITNYNASNTYTFLPAGPTVSSTGVVTATAGTYTVTSSANGCTSVASASVVINAQPATPAVPVLSTVTQPTCVVATGSFTITNYNASNTYTFLPAGPTVSATGVVTATAGTYTVTSSANGCTSAASASVVINAQPATPAVPVLSAVTQPTCAVATGSFTITNYNASNTYTFLPAGPTVSASGVVTATAGTYTVTSSANGCTSAVSTSAIVNAQPATPVVPVLSAVTQPTCAVATGSFTITNYNASNNYTFSPAGPTVSASGVVTATAGTYTVTSSANGCTSAVSTSVIVNTQPATPAVPILSAVTQPTCALATGSFTISNYNALNTYTFSPAGTTVSATGVVTATAGTYTVTSRANGCTSAVSTSVTVNAQPATPAVPVLSAVTQPTCAVATGSFTITNYNASNTYTFLPAGPTVSASGVVTAIAGTYTVTSSANGCTSVESANVVINSQPATPNTPTVGTITQPTCAVATGSFTIINYNTSNTYTFSPAGPTVSTTGVVTATAGTYTVTSSANGCTSAVSTSVTVNAQPATPVVPILSTVTQPTCALATGSFTITNYNASNTYTFSPAGPTVSTTGVVKATAGTYTVTSSANGCTSAVSTSVIVNAQPATAAVPLLSAVTQPTCAVATGSFTITNYNTSNTYTFSPAGPAVSATGVVTATAGTYTVTSSANGCTSAVSTSVTVNAQPATPAVPVLSPVTQPTCTLATGSFTITNYNTSNTYTFSPAGPTVSTTGVVTATAGTYTVTSSANGCTSAVSTSVTVNAQPVTPAVPVLSAVTQPSCALATGSFTITNYNASNTYTFLPAGPTVSAAGVVTATAGTYTVTSSANGCTSAVSTSVTVNAQPVTPAVPVLSAVTQPTCALATGSFTITNYNASNTYTFSPAGPTVSTTGVVPATAGTYTVTSSANGCISVESANVVINAQPATPAVPLLSAVTQPTCAVATGSFTITNYNTSNTYTFSPAGPAVSATGVVTATAGTYTVTSSANGCISSVSTSVTVNAQPATPAVPVLSAVTQPTCALATGSFTITNYNTSNTYTFSPAGPTVSATGVVTATAGTYTVTSSANGCTSVVSTSVTVNSQPATPAVPVLSAVTQPTCALAIGSFTITNYNASNTYTFSQAGPTISTTGVVTATAGTYTVTSSANGCISAASTSVTVDDQPATPAVPVVTAVTQPTCALATGSFTITNYNASNTYTFLPAGPTVSATGVVTATAGTYTVTSSANGCTSATSASVVINAQPATPAVPVLTTVTQPTCAVATGSFTITNYNASNNYTFLPAGPTVSATGIVTATAGTYTVTSSANGCTTVESANVVINAQPATPAVPLLSKVTQPSCALATGSFTITNYNTSNTYTFLPAGPTVSTTGVVTATAGSYTVTSSANGCSSVATVNIVIDAQPATPNTPTVGTITQPTCAVATGSIELTGLPLGAWTINPGNISGNTATTVISGLTAGSYSYTVTNAVGCSSVATINIVIDAQPATPNTPTVGTIIQPTCAVATGSIELTGLPSGAWTINPGNISGNTATTIISGLTAGSYSYTVTNAVGCSSVATINILIDAQPATPNTPTVGTITQPTCAVATGSVELTGLPAEDWTITIYPEESIITGTGTTTIVSGLISGSYNFTVTNSVGCSSVFSANAVINVQIATPSAPAVGTITQPTCAVATGSVELTGLPAGDWTISPGNISGNTATTVISGLTAGSYSYTVTNAVGCVSNAAVTVIIDAQPATPNTPTVGTITQPTCAVATGSVELTGLPSGDWTINPGNISGNTATTIISGLTAGSYSYTVTNAVGCTSVATINIVIDAQPATPSTPTVGTITQPTCAVSTGSVELTGLPAGDWTINPGNISGNTATTVISGLTGGSYSYTVTNAVGCVSNAAVTVVIDAQPATPNTPTVGTITQPICAVATGSVELTGLPSGAWTINPGNISGNTATTVISGLTAGSYTYTVTNSVGCTSVATINIVIDAQPATPSTPTVGTITQPTCAVATGSIELTGLPSGDWTINPGNISGNTATTVISGLTAGSYSYTVTNTVGCTSVATINIVIGNLICANDDTIASTGGSVLTNDTLNGNPVTTTNTDVTPVTEGPLAIDADGNLTVTPNTPSGTYTITYTICEVGANPANCDTAIATVVINNTIVANDDTIASTGGSVITNDTLNGNPVTTTNTDVTPVTDGPLTIDADGNLTVTPNTPSGTYTITYTICEVGANPANCDTAIATVVVTNTIFANDDTIASTGGSVITNDTLNGNPVTTTNTDVTPVTDGPLAIDADGNLTVTPNTPSGTYTITYTICEVGANPANCDTAIATVVINNTIVANDDTIASTGGSVLTNDTLNGTPVTTTNTDVTPVTDGPLTIDANGNLTVTPNTPSGTYTITYTICEVGANPANCDTAIATVVVTNTIVANDDTIASTGGSVLTNDTLNGTPVTTANTDVTPVTDGPLAIDADGNLTVTPNTPSGTYTITYTICEVGANPANCDTAIATVVVTNTIVANDDTIASTGGSVLTNDTLNGNPVTTTNTDVTPVTEGPLAIDADGNLTVTPNTPSGTYTITYTICEVGANPANCDTAIATVVVTNTIVANDDTIASTGGSVITNDTLNGTPVTTTNTDVTPVTQGPLAIDADGNLTVTPNTPSGTYTITYTICEVGANPANCDTAIATVVVNNTIVANDDTIASTGGSVITNDTLNGNPVTTTNTDVTPVTDGPLTIDADGILTVTPNTPSGTYTITYTICEVGANPANCDTAIATVVVNNTIVANDDTIASTGGSVLTNDTLNGNPVTTTNTDVTPVTDGPLTIDADGILTVTPNTPSGTYTITYTICEVGANPANCDTAIATVVINNTIVANDDTIASTGGSVLTNDTLNGTPVTTTNTDVTPVTDGPLAIDAEGILTVTPNTPSGTYTITYTICEVGAVPANCDTATAIVVVFNELIAVDDDYTSAPIISGNDTPSVVTNDTLNGTPVVIGNNPGEVTLTGVDVPTGLTLNPTGTITVGIDTPSGTYIVVYEICEVGAVPANCETGIVTIVVSNEIIANNDAPQVVEINVTGPVFAGNVLGNDTLNGVLVTTINTDVTPTTQGPLSIDVDGNVTI
ncbi:beta strand repeat-containing protein, partial [Flavobacterium ardleyense]